MAFPTSPMPGPVPATPMAPTPASAPAAAPKPPGPPLSEKVARLMIVLEWVSWGLGWLYVPGLFFVLLFLLLPEMDMLAVRNRQNALNDNTAPWQKTAIELEQKRDKKLEDFRKKERDLEYRREDLDDRQRELDRRENGFTGDTSQETRDALKKDRDKLKEDRDKLAKDQQNVQNDRQALNYKVNKELRSDLEKLDKDKKDWEYSAKLKRLEVSQSANNVLGRAWWYTVGLLFATILLMLGAIGYLSPKQPTLRRVVGAITIGAIILMVAARMNGGSSVLFGIHTGRPPGETVNVQ
jgi:hypothetical protein